MIFAKNFKDAKFYRSSILVWALYITYETLITYFLAGKFSRITDYVAAYALNILMFYVNSHIVLPRVHKKAFPIILFFLFLELVAYLILKYATSIAIFKLGLSGTDPFAMPGVFLTSTIWRFLNFLGLSYGYWFALNIIVQRKEISDLEKNKLLTQLHNQQLEKKLIDSEIAYLKSQINPHFLFNTLSFLYNTSLQTAPKLSRPIILLSDIMRYALTETPQSGKVDLSDEIEQIATFIELNQFRFDQNVQLQFNVSCDTSDLKILPLILLTPVENIFKYADLKNIKHPAKIDLDIKDNNLHLLISNKKLKSMRSVSSHGVGLKNLKLRLDAYYPDQHKIQISETTDNYVFELQISL